MKKCTTETFVLYSSKLKGLLNQYLAARYEKDYDKVISLMISDRIKSILPEYCLKHILSIESSMDKPFWLGPDRLAVVVDEYIANLGNSNRATSAFIGQTTSVCRFTNFTNAAETRSSGARPENLSFDGQNVRNSSVKSFGSNNTKRRCDMQAGAPTQCESAATVVTGRQNVNRVTVATVGGPG